VFLNLIVGVYEFENKGSNQKSGVVTFQLGSRNIKRQIPIESFVELAKLFIEDNKKIQLVGVNSEAHFGNEFLKHFTDKSMIDNLIGKTTIAELYEVIDNSEQLITTDTGTLHIAATLQTPTISFFVGPAYSPETAGYNPNQKIHSPTLTDFPCYPCKDDVACPYNYSCQKKIDMNKIYKAVFDKDKLENLSQPFYDELGQIILPIYEGNQITKELYFSFIYRIFAIKYFKNIDKNVSFYIQNYSINNDELIRWNSELKRELKLFNYLNFNMNTLKTAEKNFKILTPLLYLFFILKRKDAIVIQLYEFLEEIVT
ncbi:MAG: glycosyltransferase family 9 protein, partial [Candidatus Cloacimonadota bacterium]|nr:glycosyltransferase family 9 protein [Candidatus Cloacimonadota bacterium]